MMCEVCDRTNADSVYHRLAMHRTCAPKRWVVDHRNLEEFMARLHVWWAAASRWKRTWDGFKPHPVEES